MMAEQAVAATRVEHRVLLVEDQAIVAEWVRTTLADYPDISVTLCQDSQQALKTARELRPTLILQDLVMPHIDGFSLLQRYRGVDELADVPVIVLSSVEDVHEKVRAFELGAADYLVKVPHPVELVARVRAQSRAHLLRKERDHLTRELQTTMERLYDSNVKLARVAREDGLTGLANRRSFDESLENEWRRAQRSEQPTSLALIDIDFFKLYNDAYGHVRGDECLRAVAACVTGRARRPGDLAARYGGEELCILLPNTDEKGALSIGEGSRAAIEAMRLPHEGRRDGIRNVTASVGVATMVPSRGSASRALVEAADAALYRAKRAGRNQVVHTTLAR
jgi:two-component system, chemotaxis family, response regulator WspR